MTNNLVIFQTIINNIFYDFIAESIIIVYLDDISIFTWTLEEHHRVVSRVVSRVLEILVEHKLYLQTKKCEFNRQWIEYLSLVISKDQVDIDLVKVAKAYNWQIPRNYTDL